tara:strand:+ start:912 stop:1172 length:261 start_codon:yes stop_codon:yes gene_type:complete
MIIFEQLQASLKTAPDILLLGLCILSIICLFSMIFLVKNNFHKKLNENLLEKTTPPNRLGKAEIYGHEAMMLGISSEWLAPKNNNL